MPEKLYPTAPDPIFCWICGDQLGAEKWIRGHPAPFVFELKKWQLAWERHCHSRKYYRSMFGIHLAASELEKTFRSDEVCHGLFRLILVSKDEQNLPKEYSVSGVGQLQGARSGGKHLLVPPDRNRAYLGAPKEPLNDWPREGRESSGKAVIEVIPVPHPFADLKHEEGPLEGYVVHSRCWTLAEKHLGSQAIARLDLVISALPVQWGRLIDCVLQHSPPYHGHFPSIYYAFAEYQDWGLMWLPRNSDPLYIPEIDKIFQRSASSRTWQKKKNIGNIHVRRLVAKHNVPSEIVYIIAEYLEVTDARNMAIAFGEQLPVHYWRKQISDIFIETEDVDPDRINWPYLAVMLDKKDTFESEEFGRMGVLSDRLWNRRRIIDMLRPIKQHVLQEMGL